MRGRELKPHWASRTIEPSRFQKSLSRTLAKSFASPPELMAAVQSNHTGLISDTLSLGTLSESKGHPINHRRNMSGRMCRSICVPSRPSFQSVQKSIVFGRLGDCGAGGGIEGWMTRKGGIFSLHHDCGPIGGIGDRDDHRQDIIQNPQLIDERGTSRKGE